MLSLLKFKKSMVKFFPLGERFKYLGNCVEPSLSFELPAQAVHFAN